MAIDGTYKIEYATPMGKQEVVLKFITNGNVLTGTATSQNQTGVIQNGVVNENAFEFLMEAKGPIGKMKVNVKGSVDGNSIAGNLKTQLGGMPFKGMRL
jgi:hypothetical protein